MQGITLIYFFMYGTILGSFFNVVGLRVPTNTLFKYQRSYCDTCKRTLSWFELIPIFSYVFQKGFCRKCHEKISPLYPLMESLTGFLFAFTYLTFGWSSALILGLLLISMIIPITVSDLVYQKIPNKILLFFVPLFIFYQILYPSVSWGSSLTGASFAFILTFLIILLSKGGMGMGDLKYYTLFGFIFGFPQFLLLFFLSTVYGTIAGLIQMKVKNTGRKTKIPFGPYVGLSALTVFYFGEEMIQWYIQLFYR
ncbi:MAG TPA: prepilin peptidase [Atopostipes sp.]|nr:prepilin peptidase [Atopostipes sp.]